MEEYIFKLKFIVAACQETLDHPTTPDKIRRRIHQFTADLHSDISREESDFLETAHPEDVLQVSATKL